MSKFIIEFDENYECPCIKDGTDCGLNMILNCVGYYGNRNPECPLKPVRDEKTIKDLLDEHCKRIAAI